MTHVTGNANRLRPDPYTISYDIDGDGIIEEGEVSEEFNTTILDVIFPVQKPDTPHVTPD